MYYDEEGDLAEEFYEEVVPSGGRPWMKRITDSLTWQVYICVSGICDISTTKKV